MLPSLVVADGNDSLSNFPSLLSSLDCIGTSQLTSNKTNDSLSSFKREALQPLSNNSIISEKCAWSIWSQNWNWFYHYQLLSAQPGNEPFIDFSCFQNSTFYSHTKHPLTDSLWNNMQYREKRNKHLTRFVLLTIKAGVDLLFWFKKFTNFLWKGELWDNVSLREQLYLSLDWSRQKLIWVFMFTMLFLSRYRHFVEYNEPNEQHMVLRFLASLMHFHVLSLLLVGDTLDNWLARFR